MRLGTKVRRVTASLTPAKQVAVLVLVSVLALITLLFVELVRLTGPEGVVLFFALSGFVVLVALLTDFSLQAAFSAVAYAVGYVRQGIVRWGRKR